MSVFLERNHLFLRNPHGGVEDVKAMKDAGFTAIFCNIKDYMPEEWDLVRENAQREAVVCGPWSRMCSGDQGSEYDRMYLDNLIACAYDWSKAPYIVNGESEVNGHDEYVKEIEEECRGDDWAFSTEPTPFADNNWTILEDVPVLPQCFTHSYADAPGVRRQWQGYGVNCVVPTFATYGGMLPSNYPLDAPYGLYTADDCGGNFARWSPTGNANPCLNMPPPVNGGTVSDDIPPVSADDIIGSEHGITAFVDWIQKQPGIPKRDPVKYNPHKPGTWPWPERLERTLKILAAEHDAGG